MDDLSQRVQELGREDQQLRKDLRSYARLVGALYGSICGITLAGIMENALKVESMELLDFTLAAGVAGMYLGARYLARGLNPQYFRTNPQPIDAQRH